MTQPTNKEAVEWARTQLLALSLQIKQIIHALDQHLEGANNVEEEEPGEGNDNQ